MVESLALAQARLLTLKAQGLLGNRPETVLETIEHTNLLQIDSVNVFERAHYLPLFSRLGSFDKNQLDSLTGGYNPTLIEYWAHEASFIRTSELPLYLPRMQRFRAKYIEAKDSWGYENRKFLAWLKAEVNEKGPLTAGEVEHDRSARGGSWWGWSDVKRGLERLFDAGELVSAGRRKFQRLYAIPDTVLPPEILNASPDPEEAAKALILLAAKSFAVATSNDLIDYHRQPKQEGRKAIGELVEAGELVPIEVEGWSEPAYVIPAAIEAADWSNLEAQANATTTILSPFDPLAWNRERAKRLYGFDYKIEIYTPAPKRIYGYYSLPVLHNGSLVGRIDLKSDRQNSQLLVQAAWHETNLGKNEKAALAKDLSKHLAEVQRWQQLAAAQVKPVGNLADLLKV